MSQVVDTPKKNSNIDPQKELQDLKFALDASAIVAFTDDQGRITYANDKFCKISKYSRKELIGQDHRIVNSGHHSKEFIGHLWKTIMSGQIWRGEIKNKAKDGSIYWVDTTIVPFLNEEGRPYQFVAIRYEITQGKDMEQIIKSLPQQIIQAQESEKAFIAREIHDDLGQSLATLKLLVQSALDNKSGSSKLPAKSSAKIIGQINGIIEKTRHLSAGLSPATLDILGLKTAIQSLVTDYQKFKKIEITLEIDELDESAFDGGEINVYRIIQEALTNIVKHARALKVQITAGKTAEYMLIKIKDDGHGFNLLKNGKGARHPRGLGLSTMQERADLLGGTLEVESVRNKGTIISIKIPLKKRRGSHG